MPTATKTALRAEFFDYLFGSEEGYVCLATRRERDRDSFKQEFFSWPAQKADLLRFVEKQQIKHDVWFCVNILSRPERKKEFCKPTRLVWSDLDSCAPESVEPTPQCVIESSPGRYQGVWRLDQTIPAEIAEQYSKKIAYAYNAEGADPSGWDLTQLLRVPFTFNYKYDLVTPPQVKLQGALETLLPVDVFEHLPTSLAMPSENGDAIEGMPAFDDLPAPDAVLYKYYNQTINTEIPRLYMTMPDPDADWSKLLWFLLNLCFEAGMGPEEVFAVALAAKCNKYRRDGRPASYLWREIIKVQMSKRQFEAFRNVYTPLAMPTLIEDFEDEDSFVSEYKAWATEATDACPEYHDVSAMILLSTLLSANLRLATSYGEITPNLWALILGDSTLSRKTTAMRLTTDFIVDIDRDLILASDGSVEGILTGLATRPNMVSMYYRDEVTGLFDSIMRKDYMAGTAEIFTQLYDVPAIYPRKLRKETITLIKPVFLFYGGGIKEKVYSQISEDMILSGFMPRFLIVNGVTDLDRIRRTGPANPLGVEERARLLAKLQTMHNAFNSTVEVEIGGQKAMIPATTSVKLTKDAWQLYGDIEMKMVEHGQAAHSPHLALPVFERMTRSMLKIAMLLAGARQEGPHNQEVVVEERDVKCAAHYIQDWGRHSVDLIINSGKPTFQRYADKVLRAVQRKPGIMRSDIMKAQHLSKREMDEIVGTLADRGQIRVVKTGTGGFQYWPLD